ncbi:MAG: hypothetical protein HFE72_09415 [Emergencia sp.]|nr:hypothetical protein [Emergencia sp.]
MKLKFIIPVVGDFSAYSEELAAYLKPYLTAETELEFSSLQYGFETVETELAGMVNGSQVVMSVRENAEDFDGVFVDCFDDPGVYALREMGLIPAVGPYEAAVTTALSLGERIGIITTDQAGILNEEKKARAFGVSERITSIRALELMVENIKEEKERVLASLADLCADMVQKDRVSVICLGCTAMYYIYDDLLQILSERQIRVNVIEPVLNGCVTLESMVRMGYNNFIPGGVSFGTLHWSQTEGRRE